MGLVIDQLHKLRSWNIWPMSFSPMDSNGFHKIQHWTSGIYYVSLTFLPIFYKQDSIYVSIVFVSLSEVLLDFFSWVRFHVDITWTKSVGDASDAKIDVKVAPRFATQTTKRKDRFCLMKWKHFNTFMRHLICILQHHIMWCLFLQNTKTWGNKSSPKTNEQNFFILGKTTTDSPLPRPSRIPISNHPWQSSTVMGWDPNFSPGKFGRGIMRFTNWTTWSCWKIPGPQKFLKHMFFWAKHPQVSRLSTDKNPNFQIPKNQLIIKADELVLRFHPGFLGWLIGGVPWGLFDPNPHFANSLETW